MIQEPFPYTSLHDYLDTMLSHIENPSHGQIKQAKRNYWKLYHTHYRRQKRKVRREFTLGFGPDVLERILQKKGDLSVSLFLYRAVEQAIGNGHSVPGDREVLGRVDRQLMHLIDLIEDLLASEKTGLDGQVLEKIEALEMQFSQILKSRPL